MNHQKRKKRENMGREKRKRARELEIGEKGIGKLLSGSEKNKNFSIV